MSSLVRWLVAALLGGAAAFLIACGDQGGLLSSSQSARLNGALDSVSSAVAAGHCPQADLASQVLGDAVRVLSDKVDARLREKLKEGAVTVGVRAHDDCRNPVAPTTTPTTSTATDTTPTDTTPTVPPPTTPTGTTPEAPPTTPTGETTPTTPGTVTGGGGGGSGGAGPRS